MSVLHQKLGRYWEIQYLPRFGGARIQCFVKNYNHNTQCANQNTMYANQNTNVIGYSKILIMYTISLRVIFVVVVNLHTCGGNDKYDV